MTAKDLGKQWGYLYQDEIQALHDIAITLDKGICVNIGAGVGTSGMAIIECPNIAELYTVDIAWEARAIGGLGNERITFKEAGYENDSRHHQICGDSTQVGLTWSKGKVDLVFIDGDHSYEHCKSDIESWLPHVKEGGVMCLHDYESKYWPGVFQSVNEILTPKYSMILHASTFIAFRII